MATQSMTDVAFEILNRYKKPVAFQDLWQKVAKELNLTEEMAKKKISNFYTKLSMDARFVQKNGKWTLKSRMKFEESYIDTSALEIDDDTDEEEEEIDLTDEEGDYDSIKEDEDY